MIGKAYWATFKYYDSSLHKMAFKRRPILIIGQADERDYVVLPISRITKKVHKQAIVNEGELADCIVDFKTEYPDAYISVLALVEEFQKNLINKLLKNV